MCASECSLTVNVPEPLFVPAYLERKKEGHLMLNVELLFFNKTWTSTYLFNEVRGKALLDLWIADGFV